MNAVELQTIASELAALRRQATPSYHRHEAGPTPRSNRAPSQNQTGEAKRFHAPASRPASDIQPWGARPRIASVRRPSAESVASIGHNKALWAGAFLLIGVAAFRAVLHLGLEGPVIVRLFWHV